MADHKAEAVTQSELAHDGAPVKRKGGIMNTLYPPGPKPGAGGRIKNHCRRFWWCDCLVLIIVVLVIILPIIFVAIPKKAQNDINKSDLEVTSQILESPTSDSFKLKLTSVAKSYSKFHPTIDAFEASLSLAGQQDAPFLKLTIPEIKATSETEIVVEQDINIGDMDAFKRYTMTALGSEEFEVHLDGETKVRLKGLKAMDVDYNKVIKMKGLNHLSGLKISDLKVLSGKGVVLEDGSNLIGNVYIPNPSVMTLTLGNVTLNLKVDGESIGTALMPNLVVRPGDNNVPMQSRVDQLQLVGLISKKFHDGILPLEITGNSSIYNGEHLGYFEEALAKNVIKLDLDAGPPLKEIGIDITKLGGGH